MKPTTKVTPVWSLYNALDDHHFLTATILDPRLAVQADIVIPAKTKAKSLAASLVSTLKKHQEVTTETAKSQYRQRLSDLGVPDTLVGLAIGKLLRYTCRFGLASSNGVGRNVSSPSVPFMGSLMPTEANR